MLPEYYDNLYGETSRLLSGDITYYGSPIPIIEYRSKLFARSLYNPDNEYQNSTSIPESYDNQYDETSKLASGSISYYGGLIPISEYRSKLFARNLYDLENEYQNSTSLPENYDNQYDETSKLASGTISYYGGQIPIAEYRSKLFAKNTYDSDNEYRDATPDLQGDADYGYDETSKLVSGTISYNGTNIPIVEYRNKLFAKNTYDSDNEYRDATPDLQGDADYGYDETSKLSVGDISYNGTNIPIAEYRQMIFARSLYNLDSEYKNTQLFSKNGKSNLAQSISTILTVIPQYNRMQVNTNLAGNIYDAFRDEGSPLAKIGLVMLGKQMAYNSAMNLAVKYIPSMDLSQALKGNPDKIFTLNENNSITVKNPADRTFLDKVGSVASNFLGIDTYDVFGDANPFKKNPTPSEYIENTGQGQLKRFFKQINLNIYKPFTGTKDPYSKLLLDYSTEVGVTLDLKSVSILSQQPTFTFGNESFHPYSTVKFNSTAVDNANIAMDISYSGNSDSIQEYAPIAQYIINNFGDVVIKKSKGLENYVDTVSNFSIDDSKNNLVWGKDGIDKYGRTYLNMLHGDADKIIAAPEKENDPKDLNIRKGLLEYTKNLLNASSGQFVDITRKAFKKDENIVGFQGSPLWRANQSQYAIQSGTADKAGVRQHTILDPYGSDTTELEIDNMVTKGFAKSIRFKGNIVYSGTHDGNQNSVIYKTVLPRIHPTRDEGGIDNKNLMFSIENLAVGTIKRDKFGVIDDEYGTPIPLSEVGPFAGRIMWFPPYNLEINEVAIAKYEPTVMVGRNEPMYNYINSERTAVLTFSLLVDYPEQLRRLVDDAQDKNALNKEIADFFAFGGDPLPEDFQIEQKEQKIEKLKEQIKVIGGLTEQTEPVDPEVRDVMIYFPNDRPTIDEVDTIINTMYYPMHYEIITGMESAQDGTGFGLNQLMYFYTGLTNGATGNEWLPPTSLIDQYNHIGENSEFSVSELNKNLLDVYQNPDTRKYFDIEITGRASKLYLSKNEKEYNEALGNRRVEATKKLIVSKLTAMFGQSVANDLAQNNIKTFRSTGSIGGSAEGAEAKNMHLKDVKKERKAIIHMRRNTVPVTEKKQPLTETQKETIAKIQQDIQTLELQISIAKNNKKENIYNKRNKAILNGFESISGNQFYPVFHSQTPEDFHRRLTFLQQCTRQGAAKRYDIVDENTKELRARNSVFGKQPISILRVGDFFYTKVVIDSVTIDYADTTWDMNPEGFGMQPMIANITLQMKLIGGQSLKGPIDALQNAVTFNYYANSSFTNKGMYNRPAAEATKQEQYIKGVVGEKTEALNAAYNDLLEINKVTEGEQ